MGTIKTTNIEPIADNGTVTLGSSGDTFTVPSGVTVNMSSATQTGVGGTNTPAFLAYRSSSAQSLSDYTLTKCQFNAELFDTDNAFDNSTNYRFTPQTAGKYKISFFAGYGRGSSNVFYAGTIHIYKNGSNVAEQQVSTTSSQNYWTQSVSTVVDMNGSSDYVEAYIKIGTDSGTRLFNDGLHYNQFMGHKLVE